MAGLAALGPAAGNASGGEALPDPYAPPTASAAGSPTTRRPRRWQTCPHLMTRQRGPGAPNIGGKRVVSPFAPQ